MPAVVNNSTLPFPTEGTVEISVEPGSVTEGTGSSSDPDHKTLTWTLTATTKRDQLPESGLDFRMGVRTHDGSATDIDYDSVNETVRFQDTPPGHAPTTATAPSATSPRRWGP